jgi:hypothetical protein
MSIQKLSESKLYKRAKAFGDTAGIKVKLRYFRQNLARAAGRVNAQHIDITLDYLYAVGERQNWRCVATGVPLEFTRGGTRWGGKWCNPRSCTIDRINNDKGYVKGNVQLLTWEANALRGGMKWKEFINACRRVVKYNK